MVEDVRLAVEGRCPVGFHGRMGGLVPTPDEVVGALRALAGKVERTREREREQQKRHAGHAEGQSGNHRPVVAGPPEPTHRAEADVHASVRDGGER
jgi:hypothetical protein